MAALKLSEVMDSSAMTALWNSPEWKAQVEARKAREDNEALAYLRTKFPGVDEKAFFTAYTGSVSEHVIDASSVCKAAIIERTCAECKGKCSLTDRSGKPVVSIRKTLRGSQYLNIGWTCGITCRYDPLSGEFGRMFRRSGLMDSQLHKTFDSYRHDGLGREVLNAKIQAVNAAHERTNLILGGRAGTGKTHLATAIAIYAMKEGRQAIFRLTNRMLDQIRTANVRDWDEYNALMSMFEEVPCLVLDDFSKEKMTEAAADYLYQIIDGRYRRELQTIITTNALSIDELEGTKDPKYEQYITPIVSRMLERGAWVRIANSDDYRLKHGVRK